MEAINGMKVYATRDGEWFVAASVEDCIACVLATNCCETEAEARAEGHLEEGYPAELDEAALDRMKITADDEEDEDGSVGPVARTFREYLTIFPPTEAEPFCSHDW